MSVQAISAVLSPAIDELRITPAQRLVLIVLANWANEDAECWPSVRTLTAKTGLSERGVQKVLGELEAEPLGLIKRAERARPGGGRQLSNLITLVFVSDPRPPHTVHPTGAPSAPLTTLDTSADTSEDTTDADASVTRARETAFEKLVEGWKRVSPGRLAPVPARKAFDGLSDDDVAVVVAAADRYLAECPDVRRLGTAVNLHVWLRNRQFEAWSGSAPTVAAAGAPPRWSGPPELRALIVAKRGEAFASVYLDPARWDAERREILTPTTVARETLHALDLGDLCAGVRRQPRG